MQTEGEQDPPQLGDPLGVRVLVVHIVREGAEEVQLYLLGCRGEREPGVVVGEQCLVVILARSRPAPHLHNTLQ